MVENEHSVIDWDDMSESDKADAMDLLSKLNRLFDKYTDRTEPCEDSTSSE